MFGEKRGQKKIPKGGNFGERYIPCDDLIVVAQHQDEELWGTVQCFYEFIAIDKRAPWYELIIPEELPDISSFKRTGRSIVTVFDDLAGELLTTQLRIIPFFRSGRHAIILPQRFYKTHPNICANLKYISLHRGCGTLDSIKRILMYDTYEPLAKKNL
ncbi:3679_t:CDS:1 [Dentiscutata erythropus]|uniref:3679_t:CDS:1 n=1 Tax=Dentiscutata erythropus TaxID=1348616 RepID=A0A9N9JRL6_9GLOM|nr:3679_t:CDS:1 [Dentiscutata erythropus]